MQLIENMPENRSVGGSIPPLGTIRQILSQLQIVISGPRDEGRLFVRGCSGHSLWRRQQDRRAVSASTRYGGERVRMRDVLRGMVVADIE
jgi:hypothetical protein